MNNRKRNTIIITLWCIGVLLAAILTPILMYVVYAIQIKGNPEVLVTTGYWIGFITIFIPIGAIFYGYCFKLKNDNDKRYIAIYICAIIALVIIFTLILLGLSIKHPIS